MDVTESPTTEDDEKQVINDTEASHDGNTDYTEEKGSKKRKIGQWYIGKTLGKGGYSWVKMGIDSKSNKPYALKFMERRKDESGKLRKSQIKQVETEISVLRRIGKNPHIIKLIAYNLNQKYPDKDGQHRDVILLVLEYCPGGELFDLLYYTSRLQPILARTYFHQLCKGVSHLHTNGIIHRDIKPQNLLLDSNYNLKITDFGLSKICNLQQVENSDIANVKLLNPRVGTKGYQSPEIVCMGNIVKSGKTLPSDLYYKYNCDIFSMGVVLFIILTGYPPFKGADPNDKWYGQIANGNYQAFWKLHRNCGLKQYETDLITRMLFYDMEKRITMQKIQNHKWFKQETLTNEQLTQIVKLRHHKTQTMISFDRKKQQILQYSEKIQRDLSPSFAKKVLGRGRKLDEKPPILNITPNVTHCIYTTVNAYDVLCAMQQLIENNMKGIFIKTQCNVIFDDNISNNENNEKKESQESVFDVDYDIIDNFCLTATIAHLPDDEYNNIFNLNVQLYWDEKEKCNLVYFNIIGDNKDKFQEIKLWMKLKNVFVIRAKDVLTGLPKKESVQQDIAELYKKCFPDASNKKE